MAVDVLLMLVLAFLGTIGQLLQAFNTTELRLTEIRDVLIAIRDQRH